MTASTSDLLDLELKIGLPPPIFRHNYAPDNDINDLNRQNVRRWIILNGGNETKVYSASDYVLARAYHFGRNYILRMNEEGKKPPPTRRRGSFLGLDLSQEVKSLLDEEPKSGAEGPAASQATQVVIDGFGNQLEYKIAEAAAKVITPRLEAAKRELSLSTDRNIKVAVDARFLEALENATITNELRGQIIDLATTTVAETIEKLVPRVIEVRTPTTSRTLKAEPRHKKFDSILQWLLAGEHVYIVGPAGTGKTHLFNQLAEAIGKKQWPIGQSLTKYDLSGYKGPTGEYIGTLIRDAIEQGGLVTIDEGDMWAAAALGFLNQPLANGYCAFPDRVVTVHPDFQCMIAANTYGRGATQQYVGRNPLDAASLDRFAYEEVDYDNDLERQLYGSGPWTNYVQAVRAALIELKQQHIISMRATIRCIRGAHVGKSPDEIARSALWRGLAPDIVSKIKHLVGEPPEGEIVDLEAS